MGFVVIFRSVRRLDDGSLYTKWSQEMEILVKTIDGYEKHFGFRDPETRQGVTISYFSSLESIAEWKSVTDHRAAQELGREKFYEEYSVQVCEILRDYEYHA